MFGRRVKLVFLDFFFGGWKQLVNFRGEFVACMICWFIIFFKKNDGVSYHDWLVRTGIPHIISLSLPEMFGL